MAHKGMLMPSGVVKSLQRGSLRRSLKRSSWVAPEDSIIDYDAIHNTWMAIVGVSGFLDCISTVLPWYLSSEEGIFDKIGSDEDSDSQGFRWETFLRPFARWLDARSLKISLVFSALWFFDAFYDAQKRKVKATTKREKRMYLDSKYSEERTKTTGVFWWHNPNFVYYSTIIWQLVLLPVGFYYLIFEVFENSLRMLVIGDLDDSHDQIAFVGRDSEGHEVVETIDMHSKLSLIFAVTKITWLKVTGTGGEIFQENMHSFIKSRIPSVAKRILGTALKNPFKFRRKVKKTLRAIRRIKYLAPLLGAINKLIGNVKDMVKKYNQQRAAEKQRRAQSILWDETPVEIREEEAATRLQAAWRSFCARKALRALKLIRGHKEHVAAMKLQGRLRRRLFDARVRIRERENELKELETLRKKNAAKMTEEQKTRLYELQDSLTEETRELLNRRLLLRPNTKFAVYWKLLFIICISIEVIQLAVKPAVQDGRFSAEILVPSLMKDRCLLDESSKKKIEISDPGYPITEQVYCKDSFLSSMNDKVHDFLALTLSPPPITARKECRRPKKSLINRILKRSPPDEVPIHWYCQPSVERLHSLYGYVVKFLFEVFFVFVGIVCWLDVPVTFFTGELEAETGLLVPKPFFVRWIIPGLALQLLVNPNMESLYEGLNSFFGAAAELGPFRVWRWSVAVLFPSTIVFYRIILQYVWLPLVEEQNSDFAFNEYDEVQEWGW